MPSNVVFSTNLNKNYFHKKSTVFYDSKYKERKGKKIMENYVIKTIKGRVQNYFPQYFQGFQSDRTLLSK